LSRWCIVEQVKTYLELFVTFFRMGVLTFGGGYAMVPVVERELIHKKSWVSMEEVMNYFTVAQITPGIVAVNLSTFVGCKRGGIPGGFLATLGFVLPGVGFITAIAAFLANFADRPAFQHAFTGVRVAVCALILDTVIKLVKGTFKDKKALPVYFVVFILSTFWSVSPVPLVIGSGLVGFLVFREKPAPKPQNPAPDKTGEKDP
jgi:chromate transporter